MELLRHFIDREISQEEMEIYKDLSSIYDKIITAPDLMEGLRTFFR